MEIWTIAVGAVLAGALRVVLPKLGLWPDWEKRARRREEEKLVLRAYHKWRENPRSRPPADPRIARDDISNVSRRVRTLD